MECNKRKTNRIVCVRTIIQFETRVDTDEDKWRIFIFVVIKIIIKSWLMLNFFSCIFALTGVHILIIDLIIPNSGISNFPITPNWKISSVNLDSDFR